MINTDPSIFQRQHKHTGRYYVKYHFFTSSQSVCDLFENWDNNFGDAKCTTTEDICFRLLCSHFMTYVAYKPEPNEVLTKKQVRDWVNLLRQYNFVPSWTKTPRLIVDMSQYPPSYLYVALCAVRYLKEWPDVVRIALLLHQQYKLDFYLSYIWAVMTGCDNTLHTHIGITSKGSYNPPIPASYPISLKWYLKNPRQWDTTDATQGGCWCFGGERSVRCIPAVKSLPAKEFDRPGYLAAIAADSLEEAQKHLLTIT